MSKQFVIGEGSAVKIKETIRRLNDGSLLGEDAEREFTAQQTGFVQVGVETSETGVFEGTVQLLDAETLAWESSESPVYVFGAIQEGDRSLAQAFGDRDVDGEVRPLWVAQGGAGAGELVELEVVTSICPTFEELTVSGTPSGPAGGDLGGTYPNPIVLKVDGGAW